MTALAVLALVALAACDDPVSSDRELALVTRVVGLSSPVDLTAPAGDARLYIVEQPGRIRIVDGAALLPTPFLDIASRVLAGNEQGLLGLAFHPRYATNGYLYVYFTDRTGAVRIERYTRAAGGLTADPASAKTIIVVPHPFDNHNGGQVAFGPDGMLYAGIGDGGSAGDPQGNGQNPTTLLGKMLRLDVDGGDPYAIPAGNPFVNRTDARHEIWALGLRNPWRFSFDAVGGRLYVADVGQGEWEEINAVPASEAGVNYGWSTMEGGHCYAAATCNRAGLTLPVLEYANDEATCAVTGGHVYRGRQAPELDGLYFYSDYCGGFLRSFRRDGAGVTDRREWATGLGLVTAFGRDAEGELYVLTADGTVRAITLAQLPE